MIAGNKNWILLYVRDGLPTRRSSMKKCQNNYPTDSARALKTRIRMPKMDIRLVQPSYIQVGFSILLNGGQNKITP